MHRAAWSLLVAMLTMAPATAQVVVFDNSAHAYQWIGGWSVCSPGTTLDITLPPLQQGDPPPPPPAVPQAVSSHAMCYDAARSMTVLFGGRTPSSNGDTWEWSGSTWTQRIVGGPSPRYFHAMVHDTVRGVSVLFAGNSNGTPNAQTWEWNGESWAERQVSGPSTRVAHAMAFDSKRGVTVLFGGFLSAAIGETWEWNGTDWTQRMVSGPAPRYSHAMAYDAARGVTALFGGWTAGGTPSSETWEWDGSNWTQRTVATAPSPRQGHAMTYDMARGVTVLFGGYPFLGDTWEWDGKDWTQRIVSEAPSPRRHHAMAYDAARGVTVLFGGLIPGGLDGVPNAQTWEWNGSAWIQRLVSSGPQLFTYEYCPGLSSCTPFILNLLGPGVVRASVPWQVQCGFESYGGRAPRVFLPGETVGPDNLWSTSAQWAYGRAGGVTELISEGAYLGVRIRIEGRWHYGWIHWRDQAWAYETTPDTSITIPSPTCPADFNLDMIANSQDFFDFLTAFFNVDPAADFNHDGVLNSQDFFDFLQVFFDGC